MELKYLPGEFWRLLLMLLIVLNGIEITSLYGKVHVVCLLIVLNGIEI